MSRLIGTVHAIPLLSLPVLTMLLKSCSPTNPSRGLKIPSAIFSTSFRSSLLTCSVYMPSVFFLSERINRFMSLLPWGDGIDPATLYHYYYYYCYWCLFFDGSKWSPHSFCAALSHHHLPARGSSPGFIALVHGSQPMLGKPAS